MTAPDLSEHFGWVGELWLGLFGLFLLALMHKDVRFTGLALISRLYTEADRLHRSLHSNFNIYALWTDAIQLIFKYQRDLLWVLGTLVIFDYAVIAHADLIKTHLIFPLYDKHTWNDPKVLQLSYLHSYSQTLLIHLGYGLFGWLIYKRAQGASYRKAQSFRPKIKLFAFCVTLAGANIAAETITPWLFVHREWAQEPNVVAGLIGGIVLGFLMFFGGIRFITPNHQRGPALGALCSYLILTQFLQWIYFLLALVEPPYMRWLRALTSLLERFTYITLWDIALVGFIVLLASPSRLSKQTDQPKTPLSNRAANAV